MTEHVNPNSLVVVTTMASPVMSSVRGVSYDAIVAMMEAEERSGSMFPGEQYSFKKGHWFRGWGDNEEMVDKVFREKSIIVNAPNVNFAWRTFGDDNKPVWLQFANPALGQKLQDRKALGHNDKAFWPTKEFNGVAKPMDPMQRVVMIPFRFDGEKTVNHLMLSSWSGVRAVQDFMKEFGKQGRSHMGKLPVVNLDVKIEKHWEDDSITFDVPVFAIADWENPIAEDEAGVSPVSEDGQQQLPLSDIPQDGGVTQIGRVEKKSEEKPENKGFLEGLEGLSDKATTNGLFPGTEGEKAKAPAATVGNGGKRRGATNGLNGRRG